MDRKAQKMGEKGRRLRDKEAGVYRRLAAR
jgi:hypothetical protein